ncbi:MAG TPA: heme exporter protein CcmD [Gammaproteobacteria bacterium]|jgi:heme exporter protein D|nr:heme exporter protein CcmD [Pseudomonadota bacterium]HEX2238091.1 heme exporter protein CcmD [Gammaproteobacteria bacterium]
MKDFLYMDGYAFFVWSAYAVVVVVMTANLIYPLRRRRRLLREISQQASQNGIDDTET